MTFCVGAPRAVEANGEGEGGGGAAGRWEGRVAASWWPPSSFSVSTSRSNKHSQSRRTACRSKPVYQRGLHLSSWFRGRSVATYAPCWGVTADCARAPPACTLARARVLTKHPRSPEEGGSTPTADDRTQHLSNPLIALEGGEELCPGLRRRWVPAHGRCDSEVSVGGLVLGERLHHGPRHPEAARISRLDIERDGTLD